MASSRLERSAARPTETETEFALARTGIKSILDNVETIPVSGYRPPLLVGANGISDEIEDEQVTDDRPENGARAPVIPLGHNSGTYYFISPSGELRQMRAEGLEAGRGVQSLFIGMGKETDDWCSAMFPAKGDGWSPKAAGSWVIEKCNEQGVFDPSSADLRSIGVWRDLSGVAVSHCGDRVFLPDGSIRSLIQGDMRQIMIGARPIQAPELAPMPKALMRNFLKQLSLSWGWKRECDPKIWLGWLASSSLGGFPDWRAHLYVHGNRGSGKSKLIELAAHMLGDLAGQVINDATEAGLRQSRNNQARPLLIDEFEPDDNPRTASRQDSMLALFRRMSGGAGGRISRGGADHNSVSFRSLGAVYVTSINHIHLEPQDRSRFVMLELSALPTTSDPVQSGADLAELFQSCRDASASFRGRMLAQSGRWDATHTAIAARARSLGADPRQSDTTATILSGLDLALYDGDTDISRLDDLEPLIKSLIADAAESDETLEGNDALDHLLSASIPLDHGMKRTVRELLESVVSDTPIPGVDDSRAAIARFGIFVLLEKNSLALRLGRSTQIAKLYADTKWQNGAHASALVKLDGVVRSRSGVRVAPNEQHRVLLIPIDRIQLSPWDG